MMTNGDPNSDGGRGSADSHVVKYRRDIDGLRAISVLSVVAFHIQRSLLPGGFLGVDVFFVISGYLITGIIWREALARDFSIARFYERRIRRIAPALLTMLIVATAAAAAILLPRDLVGHGKAALATLTFVANIYFWRDTNYFARVAEEKPLLHMWSLGVEEQFYIFFPLLIMLLVWRTRRWAPWAVLAMTVASYLLNIAMVELGNTFPAFYLLPTRAWELGAGAFLALLPPAAAARYERFAPAGGWIGLALVVVGIVAKAQSVSAIPTTTAVIIGATLVLWAGGNGRQQGGVAKVLGFGPMVFFGLISYSLYLWHWPIIVLAKYYLVRDLTLPEGLAAFALMVVLATLSWRFIERPFRSKAMTVPRLLAWSGGGTLVVAAMAASILATGGFPSRLNGEAAAINAAVDSNYRCPVTKTLRLGTSRGCPLVLPTGNPADADVLLIGNSHAQMYAPVVADILRHRNLTGALVMANTCLPSTKVNVRSGNCNAIVASYLSEVAKLPRPKLIIIAFNWSPDQGGFVDASNTPIAITRNEVLISALDDTIDRLHAMGKQVMLIGPLAIPGEDIASITSRELAFGHPLTLPAFRPRDAFLRDFGPAIDHFAARRDIVFARVDETQCATGRCDYIHDGRSLFSDSNHLGQAALPRFEPALDAAFAQALARTKTAPR